MGRNFVQRALRRRRKRRTANRRWFTIEANGAPPWHLELPVGGHTEALLPSLTRLHAAEAGRYAAPMHFHFGKWKSDRVRLIADSDQGRVYLRLYHLGQWWPVSSMLGRRGQRGPFEARCASRLRAGGIVHPAIVSAGPLRRARLISGSYAIQHHLAGYVLLMDHLRGESGTQPDSRDMEPLCGELGAFIARLFDHGILHGQLDPGHILIAPEAAGPAELGLNDLEHIHLYDAPVPVPRRAEALARMVRKLLEMPGAEENHARRLVEAYLAHDPRMQEAGIGWEQIIEA